ncbi:MAG: Rne/Rng family ribonuclease [Rhizobiaceae bacterium]|nr:Rne/Rng family ribonuclease [Rhizobiaceae bacterium]
MSADNDGDDVVSEPAKPKKKTTRAPRKKKSDVVAETAAADDNADDNADGNGNSDATSDQPAQTAEDAAEATSKEPPKRQRRRTSRVKAKPDSEVAADESPVEPDSNADVAKESQEADAKEEKPKRRRTSRKKKTEEDAEAPSVEAADATDTSVVAESVADSSDAAEDETESKPRKSRSRSRSRRRKPKDDANDIDASGDAENGDAVEEIGSEDAMEEVPARRAPRRHYKIQEVIKRRQILLVQVVKEERGNKGAALTTYLSLAGRYSVLMPNTARGGGISRKITNASDRKRLKAVAANLEVPQGMGVILRTAGASRQPEDIQRDFEYLMRLWENVRSLTLESTAPYLVYEEGSLIKRSIRDMYDKDTGEIMVAGDAGYREAKDFMTMLMPNHAKNVKLYRDRIPMFARMGVEAQLDAMLQPEVTLKSGGYIIIDQTEALVAIDVNSGRSTRQHSVEETAVQTNLEAADEVARQLRLRDLAGLIVIDFIDMEDKRNIRSVEKRLKEALKEDRARIQVGRISHFGLMEMSRQRIRASVLESTTQTCPTCEGLGHVRAASSVAISVLRTIEEQLNRNSRNNLIVKVSTETALYVLNNKRDNLGDLESRFNVSISIATDDSLGSTPCAIERGEVSSRRASPEAAVQPDSIELTEEDEEAVVAKSDDDGEASADEAAQAGDTDAEQAPNNEQEKPAGRVKRTRRTRAKKAESDAAETTSDEASEAPADAAAEAQDDAGSEPEKPAKPRRKRVSKKAAAAEQDSADSEITETAAPSVAASDLVDAATDENEPPAKPKRRTTRRKKTESAAAVGGETITAQEPQAAVEMSASADPITADSEPKKGGWWQRKFF